MTAPSADLLAIVPALNEEATVADVVAGIRRDLGADVIVIDDGVVVADGEPSAAIAAYRELMA